jgi:hypothetical protein
MTRLRRSRGYDPRLGQLPMLSLSDTAEVKHVMVNLAH